MIYYFFIALATFMLTSCRHFNDTLLDVAQIKYDSAENVEFMRKFGGPGYEYGVKATFFGSKLFISGNTNGSFGNTTDIFFSEISPSGNILNSFIFGGTHRDTIQSLVTLGSNGLLFLGNTQSLFHTPLKDLTNPSREERPIVALANLDGSFKWISVIEERGMSLLDGVLDSATNQLFLAGYVEDRFAIVIFDETGNFKSAYKGEPGALVDVGSLKNAPIYFGNLNKNGHFQGVISLGGLTGVPEKGKLLEAEEGDVVIQRANKLRDDGIIVSGIAKISTKQNIPFLALLDSQFGVRVAVLLVFDASQTFQAQSVSETISGAILVSGVLYKSSKNPQPYAVLLSREGDILSEKIWQTPSGWGIDYSIEMKDRSIIAAGVIDEDLDGKADFFAHRFFMPDTKGAIGLVKTRKFALSLKEEPIVFTPFSPHRVVDVKDKIYIKSLQK